MSPPPPPPPPPATTDSKPNNTTPPPSPPVPPTGASGSSLVNLLIYNGHPFNDHWAYFVQSCTCKSIGVKIHATGSVRTGFLFEVKRRHDLRNTADVPTQVVPLQWVSGMFFDEGAMLGSEHGVGEEGVVDTEAVCGFERALKSVGVPGKSLRGVEDAPRERAGRRITQRDCQTWIVESAEQLVRDGIFMEDVADYLRAIQQ
ncbi:hypothetical protein BJX76DRAFT_354286 [Aspergillus varians]